MTMREEEILLNLFEYCINLSKQQADAYGLKHRKFGFVLDSEVLENGSIWCRPDTYERNTPQFLLRTFDRVNQSYRHASLLDAPFVIKMDTYPDKSGGRKGKISVDYNYNRDSLIHLEHVNNNYCLFNAIEVARIHESFMKGNKKHGLHGNFNKKNFYKLVTSPQALQKRIEQIMKEIGAPLDQESYSLHDYGPKLQEYYDKKYGVGTYRILCYNERGDYSASWASDTKIAAFKMGICILYENNHFYPIRKMTTFFGVNYYCIYCQAVFNDRHNHTTKCIAKCRFCGLFESGTCLAQADFREQ